MLLAACAHHGPPVYISNPSRGGVERSQAGELVPYPDTAGWYCVSPETMARIILEAKQRLGLPKENPQ